MDHEISTRTQETIAGLRAAADWLEAHPVVATTGDVTIQLDTYGDDNDRERAGAMLRILGPCAKGWGASMLTLRKMMSPGVQIVAYFWRDAICTARQVGTRTVPASLAREEPIYEWDCPALLGEGEGEGSP